MLRIEDTDEARNRPEWVDGILNALSAIHINADDPTFTGPYFRSHNIEGQREAALRLGERKAYYSKAPSACPATR
ncbi:glutamate--tRNA ligase family protein [Streptomyces acidiscabies]|uniref:Glutamate--tRNA ligase family protein n=1 Tax=Streptomyces acidiscabies TaxID=42234 RepID=A0AAP6BLW9_9ACTN|nr:glutamate--tRNA ligase family protein [Streptomyces acidiscabies]MBP5942187.1 hypothetical protein [Streptomyces sp. LBUM 1476]MBZ3913702.1 hypothetical protein [Streptomyces acidiscabies]MDX2967194.1 glutamate--tRNA ligase family protein [Streptomyces acidiscabies]MDX3025908.1 glutamate--tRNA ligase family protein [Streptomyces acidiscabies]MDX3796832.1 glutamate--tRNA ligase family protein [Streptomyces acidiscabies]